MSVELTTKFAPQTDDLFKAESKVGLLTNTDYDWTGAHAIKLYKISTTPLNDYSRNRVTAQEDTEAQLSRYGKLLDLSATTEELLLKHLQGMKIDLVCVKLERSASTITKLLAAALDALEVPEITQ